MSNKRGCLKVQTIQFFLFEFLVERVDDNQEVGGDGCDDVNILKQEIIDERRAIDKDFLTNQEVQQQEPSDAEVVDELGQDFQQDDEKCSFGEGEDEGQHQLGLAFECSIHQQHGSNHQEPSEKYQTNVDTEHGLSCDGENVKINIFSNGYATKRSGGNFSLDFSLTIVDFIPFLMLGHCWIVVVLIVIGGGIDKR